MVKLTVKCSRPPKSTGVYPSNCSGPSPSKSSDPSPSKSSGSQRRSTRVQAMSATSKVADKGTAETQLVKSGASQSRRASKRTDKGTAKSQLVESDPTQSTGSRKLATKVKAETEADMCDGNQVPKVLTTWCRPAGLFKVISTLTDAQKEAVREIGFGGLLHLKLSVLPHTMLREILHAFRHPPCFEITETQKFILTEDDVCDVFGLPNAGEDLPLLSTGGGTSGSSVGDLLKRRWRDKYGITNNKSAIYVNKHSESFKPNAADDDFKKTFVLYAMSSFLAPTTGCPLDLRLLYAVEDVSKIKQFNWCRFVFSELGSTVCEALQGRSNIRACVPFLAIAYFHRYLFKHDKLSNELPLIQHWDDQHFAQRLSRDLVAGGLGSGELSSTVFPISRQNLDAPAGNSGGRGRCIVMDIPADIRTDEEVHSVAIDPVHELILLNERDSEVFCNRYVERAKLIKLKMQAKCDSRSYKETEVGSPVAGQSAKYQTENVNREGTQPLPATPSSFTDQVIRELDERVKEVLTLRQTCLSRPIIPEKVSQKEDENSPPSFNLFSQFYEITLGLTNINPAVVETLSAQDSPVVKEPPKEFMSFDNSPVCLDDIVATVCDDVEYHYGDRVGIVDRDDRDGFAEQVGKVHEVGEEGVDVGGVNKDVDIDSADVVVDDYLVDDIPENLGSEAFVTAEDAEVVMSANADLLLGAASVVENTDTQMVDVVLEDAAVDDLNPPVGNSPGNRSVQKNIRTSYLLHSASHEGLMSVVAESFGCSIDCGEVDPDLVVLSRTMIETKHVFNPMLPLRKQVADYCFLNDNNIPLSDNIVTWGIQHYLNKEDMETMIPGQMIMIGVIEWWSLFINDICISGTPSRLFIGLGQKNPLDRICVPVEGEKATRIELVDEVKSSFRSFVKNNKKVCDLNSDMIFIPVILDQHFSCLCVNFIRKRVEYLDNVFQDEMFNDSREDSLLLVYCQTLLGIMSEFLVEDGVERGVEVRDYEIVNVPFSWQTPGIENLDCGVYLMLHMLFYRGSVFDCDLGNPDSRALYRAEITALLVLSDMNESKAEVLDWLSQLSSTKEQTLRRLEEKRRMQLLEDSTSGKGTKRKQCSRLKSVAKKARTPESAVESRVGSTVTNSEQVSIGSPVTRSQGEMFSFDSPESPKSVLGSRKRGKGDDGLGCSLDCGGEDKNAGVVSDFMRKNKKLFCKMPKLRKEVLDYAFRVGSDFLPTEFLALYNDDIGMFLDREDIVSILPSSLMSTRVVECWSTLLNSLEFKERSKPSSMFFGLRHMQDGLISLLENVEASTPVWSQSSRLFESWDRYIQSCYNKCQLNSDLIFVPLVYNDHYSCVCINFIHKRIELLDNTYHDDAGFCSDFKKLAEIVAGHISAYLKSKKIIKNDDCQHFEVVDVAFKWKKKDLNNEESGCFLLYIMAEYDGTGFMPELNSKISRRMYCAEIAAALILADINKLRDSVIQKVEKCQTRRPKTLGKPPTGKVKQQASLTASDSDSGVSVAPLNVVYPAV